ncbi:MAG: glycosyltransferase [Lachnospiraceae bacterium]|nr:glycosyltransferase [Lachnospiraceae bacterium]
MDTLVIPSYYESFGYVVLEAMKRSIPVTETVNTQQQFLLNRVKEYSAEKMCNTYIDLWNRL